MIMMLINECRASEYEPIPNNFTSARGPPLLVSLCSVLFCHPNRRTKLNVRRALVMQPASFPCCDDTIQTFGARVPVFRDLATKFIIII